MMKRWIAFAAAATFLSCAPSPGTGTGDGKDTAKAEAPSAAAASAAGSAANIDTAKVGELIKRYYASSGQIPEDVEMVVAEMKPSKISGLTEGTLRLSRGAQSQELPFLLSADGRWFLRVDPVDLTVDPVQEVVSKIDTGDSNPSRGPKDAAVTIVEYSDFQCPFCTKGYTTLETEVLPAYKDKVRFCYKHLPLPFHPWAEPAAIAMECMEAQSPDAAWNVYKGYFEKQKEVTPANVKDKALEFTAADKIDKAKFDKCYDGKETAAKVKADKDEAAALGLSGTPSFVINGRFVKGAQPAANFKAVIDDELAAK